MSRLAGEMRVGWDVTPLTTGRTGVARYVRQLTQSLGALGLEARSVAFGRGPHPALADSRRVRVPLRVMQPVWRACGRPRIERWVGAVDVVHVFDLAPPPAAAPVVVTVHDLAAIERPDLHPPSNAAQQRRQLDAARAAAGVVTVSAATADGLVAAGIDRDVITVTPLGRTPLPAPMTKPVIDGPYVLAVGEVTARKGLSTLIAAFASAELPPDFRLVLAGPMGFRHDEVVRAAGAQVQLLGAVDDVVLATLYRDAVALCFPSLAEGFGLPVLEALAVGLPVIASDIAVVRELVADAAVLVTAEDVDAWADALTRVVHDAPLRGRLKARGPERAAPYTWTRTAELTVAAYEKAVRCA